MTDLDNILKSRDITLPTKINIVKFVVFPVVMYGCESWTIKKADCQRTDAFELFQFALIHGPNNSSSYAILFFTASDFASITGHIHSCALFLLWLHHSFWSYFSTLLQEHIGWLPTWGVYLSLSYLVAFSYCSWDSQGKNTEVVCHSLLQWTTFCQNSPP